MKRFLLQKADTKAMTADIFKKYVDEGVLKRHCSTLHLRFVGGLVLATRFAVAEATGNDGVRCKHNYGICVLLLGMILGLLVLCLGFHAGWRTRVWVVKWGTPLRSRSASLRSQSPVARTVLQLRRCSTEQPHSRRRKMLLPCSGLSSR